MLSLRERMVEDMILAGLAESTKKSYLRQVEGLARHYMIAPDELSERQVREYFFVLAGEEAGFAGGVSAGASAEFDSFTMSRWRMTGRSFQKKDCRASPETSAGRAIGRRSANVAGRDPRSGLSCMYVHYVRLWTTDQRGVASSDLGGRLAADAA